MKSKALLLAIYFIASIVGISALGARGSSSSKPCYAIDSFDDFPNRDSVRRGILNQIRADIGALELYIEPLESYLQHPDRRVKVLGATEEMHPFFKVRLGAILEKIRHLRNQEPASDTFFHPNDLKIFTDKIVPSIPHLESGGEQRWFFANDGLFAQITDIFLLIDAIALISRSAEIDTAIVKAAQNLFEQTRTWAGTSRDVPYSSNENFYSRLATTVNDLDRAAHLRIYKRMSRDSSGTGAQGSKKDRLQGIFGNRLHRLIPLSVVTADAKLAQDLKMARDKEIRLVRERIAAFDSGEGPLGTEFLFFGWPSKEVQTLFPWRGDRHSRWNEPVHPVVASLQKSLQVEFEKSPRFLEKTDDIVDAELLPRLVFPGDHFRAQYLLSKQYYDLVWTKSQPKSPDSKIKGNGFTDLHFTGQQPHALFLKTILETRRFLPLEPHNPFATKVLSDFLESLTTASEVDFARFNQTGKYDDIGMLRTEAQVKEALKIDRINRLLFGERSSLDEGIPKPSVNLWETILDFGTETEIKMVIEWIRFHVPRSEKRTMQLRGNPFHPMLDHLIMNANINLHVRSQGAGTFLFDLWESFRLDDSLVQILRPGPATGYLLAFASFKPTLGRSVERASFLQGWLYLADPSSVVNPGFDFSRIFRFGRHSETSVRGNLRKIGFFERLAKDNLGRSSDWFYSIAKVYPGMLDHFDSSSEIYRKIDEMGAHNFKGLPRVSYPADVFNALRFNTSLVPDPAMASVWEDYLLKKR